MIAKSKSDLLLAIGFMTPAVLAFGALHFYPMIKAFLMSLQERHMLDPTGTFVGSRNYVEALTDPTFWYSIGITFLWVGTVISLQCIAALGLAVLLNSKLKGISVARGIAVVAWPTPIFVAAFMFRFILNTNYGIVNHFLIRLGLISEPIEWFSSPGGAFVAITLAAFWRFLPFMFVLFLARLQAVPTLLYEAARLDGANRLQLFRYVTLPIIMPVVWIALLLRTMWLFNHFELVYILTLGGPQNATTTIAIYTYVKAFRFFQLGKGAAIGMLGFCFVLVMMILYLRFYTKAEKAI